jgi:hypothetical protein
VGIRTKALSTVPTSERMIEKFLLILIPIVSGCCSCCLGSF